MKITHFLKFFRFPCFFLPLFLPFLALSLRFLPDVSGRTFKFTLPPMLARMMPLTSESMVTVKAFPKLVEYKGHNPPAASLLPPRNPSTSRRFRRNRRSRKTAPKIWRNDPWSDRRKRSGHPSRRKGGHHFRHTVGGELLLHQIQCLLRFGVVRKVGDQAVFHVYPVPGKDRKNQHRDGNEKNRFRLSMINVERFVIKSVSVF